jgi:uncharacterized protein (TIGR02246 family)
VVALAGPIDVVTRLIEAWNRGDAAAFAGLFSSSAEYTAGSGERCVGRIEIASLAARAAASPVLLAGRPAVQRKGVTAVVRFAWTAGGAARPERRGVVTCEPRRGAASRWLIERLRNVESP